MKETHWNPLKSNERLTFSKKKLKGKLFFFFWQLWTRKGKMIMIIKTYLLYNFLYSIELQFGLQMKLINEPRLRYLDDPERKGMPAEILGAISEGILWRTLPWLPGLIFEGIPGRSPGLILHRISSRHSRGIPGSISRKILGKNPRRILARFPGKTPRRIPLKKSRKESLEELREESW